AGLVNECCATYMAHPSSLSARSTTDERLNDLCEVMREVSIAAEQKLTDPTARREVQGLTSRYVAFLAMANLVIYRRAGASLIDVARKVGEWRAILQQCTWLDFIATMQLRTMGRILLPTTLVQLAIKLGLDKRI